VTVHGRRRRLVAEVTDDGRGMSAASDDGRAENCASSGIGMTVMRERAARWGGSVRVRQPATGGTSVLLNLPLPTSLPATPTDPEVSP
jgi:signal transduction histidine kinase